MLEKDKIGQDLLFLKENIPEGYNVIKEMIKIKKEYKKRELSNLALFLIFNFRLYIFN